MKSKANVKTLTFIALMSAISTVIYLVLPEIPIVPGVDYLKIDFSDVPAIMSSISFGPLSGVCVELIKNLIHLFRSTTAGIGELMNIGIASAMILSLIGFSKLFAKILKKNELSAGVYYISSVLAIAVTILAGWILNAVLTPIFFLIMGIPVTAEAVFAGVVGSTLLNAIKAAFNLLPFFPMYYAVDKGIRKIYR